MTFFPIDRVMPLAVRADKLRGVHHAICVENTEGDGNPGYRVKVKFPWLNEEEKTYWARIAVPMGGNDRGTYFLPDPDDQLLVVFEHGDIDNPIVIGALWSKKQEPVEVNQTGKNNTKLIKSRSGHRIIFDDKDGSEKVIIVDKSRKNKIVLDAPQKLVQIQCEGDIEIKAKDNIIIHSKALKAGTTDGWKASGKAYKSHAAANFTFKSSGDITVTASQVTINESASPACQVTGSGAGSLEGVATEAAGEQVQENAGGAGGGGGGGGAGAGAGGAGSGGSGAGGAGGSSGGGAGSPSADASVQAQASAAGTDYFGGGSVVEASGSIEVDASGNITATGEISGSAAGGALSGGASGTASAGPGGASASGSASASASGAAEGGGNAAGGSASVGAEGSASAGPGGAQASGKAEAGASGEASASAGGANAGASGSAGASAEGSASAGPGGAQASGKAEAGASGEANASAGGANAGASGSAGASAEGSASAGPGGAQAGGKAVAGASGEANA
ncbi:MAG: phage baseplate assembly protein V, partial [Kofleriaceae bacterium]